MTSRTLFGLAVLTPLLAAACSSPTTPTVPPVPPAVSNEASQPPPPPPAEPPRPPASQNARYRVTFQATWNAATHSVDFPASAHFSSLTGGTHAASAVFWSEGALASAGIRDMAERGRISPLDQEIMSAINRGAADAVFTGGAIDKSPGTVSMEFSISQRFPLVTLVSMVAPSPDWFVGVNGLALFADGQWAEERRVDLVAWDAGTDSGTTFFSPDSVTNPPAPISRIQTAPLSPGGQVTPLGTFTFTKIG